MARLIPSGVGCKGASSSPSTTMLDDTQLRLDGPDERLLLLLALPVFHRPKKPARGDGDEDKEAVSSGARKKSFSFEASAPAAALSLVVGSRPPEPDPGCPLLPDPAGVRAPLPPLPSWLCGRPRAPAPPFPRSRVCPLATLACALAVADPRDRAEDSEAADNHPRPRLSRPSRDRLRSASTSSSSSFISPSFSLPAFSLWTRGALGRLVSMDEEVRW